MSKSCRPEHSRWLAIALAEGPEALDESARRALEACPSCSRELREVGALEDLLASAAEEEREVLASITPAALERELEFVSEVHRTRLAPGAATTAAPRSARFAWWLAAAGVLAALYLLARERPQGTDPAPDVDLSGDHPLSAADLEPNGTVPAFDALRWRVGDDVSSWQVVVLDEEGVELQRFDRVHGTSVELDSLETATWPDRIRWTVTPRDTGGRLRPEAAASARAERSR